jgi:uncharacterized protein YjbI with pentapeptide repeats
MMRAAAYLLNLAGTKFDDNCTGVNLYGANLGYMSNLNRVNLENAKFHWANLVEASFNGANLWGADFDGANLKRAEFGEADLRLARLNNAMLEGAFVGDDWTIVNGKLHHDEHECENPAHWS